MNASESTPTPPGLAFWKPDTTVLFTTFDGWAPEQWGCVGWTHESSRDDALKRHTDPFIVVVGITKGKPRTPKELQGQVAGFMLMGHERCDRSEATHPMHHLLEPDAWRHSVRALRAFSYLPEKRFTCEDFYPEYKRFSRPIGSLGRDITDAEQINRLKTTPCVEDPVYPAHGLLTDEAGQTDLPSAPSRPAAARVRAGPIPTGDYRVHAADANQPRRLYVLQLTGQAADWLEPNVECEGQIVCKVGLSISPERRRDDFRKAMPYGRFDWKVRRSSAAKHPIGFTPNAALAGEKTITTMLAEHVHNQDAQHLGGEFYLASPEDIDAAWKAGCEKAATIDAD